MLSPSRVALRAQVASKKRALEMLGELIVQEDPSLNQAEVFNSLWERERLGSTGLGRGVAIPHGRLKGIEQMRCAFMRFKEPVDFDTADDQPVDMACALLVPAESTSEHLNTLALLAEMFSDVEFCAELRAARSDQELYALLTSWQRSGEDRVVEPSA
jgi:PTS system nitrogen regulatory IIA component